MDPTKTILNNESELKKICQSLADKLANGAVIYLQGTLGTGKTTFVRTLLQTMGVTGKIKSPTFTLVESYIITETINCYHFDLYRITDPLELEYIGIRDYFKEPALIIIEWPQKASRLLPPPDLLIELDFYNSGRKLTVNSYTKKGEIIQDSL